MIEWSALIDVSVDYTKTISSTEYWTSMQKKRHVFTLHHRKILILILGKVIFSQSGIRHLHNIYKEILQLHKNVLIILSPKRIIVLPWLSSESKKASIRRGYIAFIRTIQQQEHYPDIDVRNKLANKIYDMQ